VLIRYAMSSLVYLLERCRVEHVKVESSLDGLVDSRMLLLDKEEVRPRVKI
jgi:hypothetical protein